MLYMDIALELVDCINIVAVILAFVCGVIFAGIFFAVLLSSEGE